jgi:hypothetical protein
MLFAVIMPAQPSWYIRVPDILGRLRAPTAPPFLDRPAIEQLFRVSRRQAIRLMGVSSGYQIGKTFLVDRQSLVVFLESVEKSGAAPQARARKQRVLTALNEAANQTAARRIQIRTDSLSDLARTTCEFPPAIELVAPGKLQITYRGAEDLLARIVELAASATTDFPAFRTRYEGPR